MYREVILNLARPTPEDPLFYERWSELGRVLTEVPPDRASVTVLVVDQHFPVTAELISSYPNLRFVVSATTGHTHLRFRPEDHGVTLLTLRGETAFLREVRSVAEFTLLLMLRMSRPDSGIGHTLNGKQLGIVGCGRIGFQVWGIAKDMGMKVMTYDRGDSYEYLQTLFRVSDFVSIHLEENAETSGMVSAALLNLMKPTAYIVNTARGSIIDEFALSMALKNKRLAGAAVDVVTANSPLYEPHPNLIHTHHIAGNTLEDRIKTDTFMVGKLKRCLDAHDHVSL